jgi:hypothetical protein
MKHAITVAVAFVGLAGLARAADLPCGPVDKGTIQLDGLTDDWSDVAGLDGGGRDGNASFTLKCNIEDGRTLMLLVDVRDNYMVRTRQARPGEDHLQLTLAGRPLTVFPGDARAIPTVVRWGTKPAPTVKAVSALQTHGYAVELAVPLATLPAYKQGMPLAFRAELADSDSKAELKVERTVDLAGSILFAEGDSALDAFLTDRKLRRSDIWFDKGARLGGKSGARLVVAGRNLAAITDGYVYLELPIQSRADVKDVRLVDLAGDGREALALRYVERGAGGAAASGGVAGGGGAPGKSSGGGPAGAGGAAGKAAGAGGAAGRAPGAGAAGGGSGAARSGGAKPADGGGSREILAVYRVVGDSEIRRVFAAEVAKATPQGRIDDKVAFVRRGRATDIVIDAGRAEGFSATNFHETPATDLIPIMLPWADDRHARYQFVGDEYKRAQ